MSREHDIYKQVVEFHGSLRIIKMSQEFYNHNATSRKIQEFTANLYLKNLYIFGTLVSGAIGSDDYKMTVK
jgi:hypothetical protein